MRATSTGVILACLLAGCGGSPSGPTRTGGDPARGTGLVLAWTTAAATGADVFALCLSRVPTAGCFSAPPSWAASGAPGTPTNLSANVSGGSVALSWSAPAGGDPVVSYIVEAGSSPGLSDLASVQTGSTSTTFSASGVAAGRYYVRVRAAGATGAGPASNEVTVVVGTSCAGAPAAPDGLRVTSNAGGTVVLAWAAVAGATSYVLEAGTTPGASNVSNSDVGGTTTATASGVSAGTYYVRVRARNSCGTGAASSELTLTVGTPTGEVPPVLSVPIVDLSGTYDAATGRLGSLNCTYRFATDANDRWCFEAFGILKGGTRPNVSYNYKTMAGATVYAAAAGTVYRVEAETNPLYPGEYEIETRTEQTGDYLVIYDHVKNLQVAVGSAVQPGTALGTAGIHTSDPAVWGRVELQINKVTERTPRVQSLSLCPRAFGTASFNAAHERALAAHNAANPSFAALSVCAAEQLGPF